MRKSVIIVGGGIGFRMGTEIPKQFLLLNNVPIIMHSLNQFHEYDKNIQIILVLPENQIEYWHKLCIDYNFSITYKLVIGGETRFDSVKNGLKHIKENEIVAVHDGVRPLVNINIIKNCFALALEKGNAVPYININESIRKISNKGNLAVKRSEYVTIQTPQVFKSDLLLSSYKQDFREEFTDDASVVEYLGEKINLIEGNSENIKITNPIDLKYAEILLNNVI